LQSPRRYDTLRIWTTAVSASFQVRTERLNDEPNGMTDRATTAWGYVAVGVAIGIASVYCFAFLLPGRVSDHTPLAEVLNALKEPSRWVNRLVTHLTDYLEVQSSSRSAVHSGCYLLLTAGALPWLAMAILRRGHPSQLGCRFPNRYGWRIVLVSYLIALPFLVWMVRGTRFAGPYLAQLERWGGPVFLAYYLANMLAEHFLFHGAMLAAFRVGRRWPDPPPTADANGVGFNRVLQWLGMAQPLNGARGFKRVTRWFGLPTGCVLAILASAALFGFIHATKDFRELLLSIPGGIALAYVAYRTNSWLTPFVLHACTAGTACAMILWAR